MPSTSAASGSACSRSRGWNRHPCISPYIAWTTRCTSAGSIAKHSAYCARFTKESRSAKPSNPDSEEARCLLRNVRPAWSSGSASLRRWGGSAARKPIRRNPEARCRKDPTPRMKSALLQIEKLHTLFVKAVSALQSPLLLVVRLYWGLQLSQSGWGKLHHLSNVTEYFTSLGLPMPAQMAVFIACIEFFGGIFLALGLASRITSLILTVNLIMAYVIGDHEALLSFFSDPDKFMAAAPFIFLMVSLIVLIFGAGKISADSLLERFAGKQ